MIKLDEVPDDVAVAWFGKPWDDACTDDIQVEIPEGYFCNRCITEFNERSSGTAVRDTGITWNFYHADCWGEHIMEARDIIRDVLGEDDRDR